MTSRADHPDLIKQNFKQQIKSIFDDLSTKYDRMVKSYDSEASQNFEKVISSTAKIISSYWNIPPKIIVEDLNTEKLRQEDNKVGLPDIPTYQIRFSLEEGSWIIFLRDFYRSSIKEHFNRLLSLEELIWNTGASTLEDLAYYIIEIDQIANLYVKPTIDLWLNDHDYSTIEEFGPIIIASYHQTSHRMGRIMFDGGKRLLQSKLERLEQVKELKYESSWSKKAKTISNALKADLKAGELNKETYCFLITLAIFQREVILENQSQEIQDVRSEDDSDELWNLLETNDPEKRALFKDRVILLLYQQQDPNPIDAMESVIDLVFENIDIPKTEVDKIKNKIGQQIEYRKSKMVNGSEEGVIVELIQKTLPKELFEIGRKIHEQQITETKNQNIDDLDVWIYFSDNLMRLKRVDNLEQAQILAEKAVRLVFDKLVEMKLEPMEASDRILQRIEPELEIPEQIISNTSKDIIKDAEDFTDPTKIPKLEKMIISKITNLVVDQFDFH